MKRILESCEPNTVLAYFEELTKIPRESGHIKQVSDWLVAFAKKHALEYRQDEAGNVIIKKPASPGYEKIKPVMIQGHMDMVAAKTKESTHDFAKDPLRLRVDGDRVFADGTTLGGDNGIAVACALALLADPSACHPRLECVFTADEEIGMLGAAAMDMSDLEAAYMINLDSDEEGIFTVSCAGGLRYNLFVPVQRETFSGTKAVLRVNGLLGGHSGTEIHKGRLNAGKELIRILKELRENVPFRLEALFCGGQDNVIPSRGEAEIRIETEDEAKLEELASGIGLKWTAEHRAAEPGISFEILKAGRGREECLTGESTLRVLDFLEALPNGVLAMSRDLPGLVQTSLNLGILSLEPDRLLAAFSIRSSVEEEKQRTGRRLEKITQDFGGFFTSSGNYPGWRFEKDSAFRELAAETYRKLYGKEPVIEAIHAGLECGVFKARMPGLQILALGPNLYDIHSPQESFSLSSVRRVWEFLRTLLADMKAFSS
ncbi:MAG: aminoacyl-histidine dipeptidase [Lachnospiraceae bacterium]|nr:aminoacyl-histidine dipeptidase [Lachnospiraceae bacterium]